MCGAELVLSLGLHWQSVRELLNSPFCLASWYSHWWCRIQALKWITKINLVVMQKMWDNAQISLSPDLGELFPVSFIHIFFHLRFRVSLELKSLLPQMASNHLFIGQFNHFKKHAREQMWVWWSQWLGRFPITGWQEIWD